MTWLGCPDRGLNDCDPQPHADRISGLCRRARADRLFSDHHAEHKAPLISLGGMRNFVPWCGFSSIRSGHAGTIQTFGQLMESGEC